MKNFTAAILLLLSFQSSIAQSVINGTVTDSANGKPLEFATVQLPEIHVLTFTDAQGNFALNNIPSGTFLLKISYTGYETFIEQVKISSEQITVTVKLQTLEVETEEVVVYGTHQSDWKNTPMNITSISRRDIIGNGGLSLSNAIAKLPGMGEMTTGGISKPVIRGLYGNRIQTVLLGIRFDNQQWQDEHGLGLSDAGIDRVEIIKGPAALTYGSEAMGGVINIIEEKPAAANTTNEDVTLKFFSNTLGYSVDGGVKGANEKTNWRIRLGTESQADYSDGNGDRVFNTRFGGYAGKFSVGFRKPHWVMQNNYMFSLYNFGFVLPGHEADTTAVDGRWSRNTDGPHHTVLFNILSSENTFFKGQSKIKFNLGVHSNSRREKEGGNRVSLNMLLNTIDALLQWNHPLGKKGEWNLGMNNMFQNNTNLGSRVIVPDANFLESGIYFSLNEPLGKFVFEGGVRVDFKNIHTFETGILNVPDSLNPNGPGSAILPFSRNYQTENGSLGLSWNPNEHLNIKLNGATGFRAPNLAELSSNGLHEGTNRWEIGNPEMKYEQNLNLEFQVNTEFKSLRITVAAYNNSFLNYIYLTPSAFEYFGFPIYNYVQKDATLQGGELSLDIHPVSVKWFDLNCGYSKIIGKTSDNEFLPFIPADKISASIRIESDCDKKISHPSIELGSDYVFAQNNPAQFETVTPEYFLVHANAGFKLKGKKTKTAFSLVANNLLNEVYFDHLSRFKYLGVFNPGRDIVLNIQFSF